MSSTLRENSPTLDLLYGGINAGHKSQLKHSILNTSLLSNVILISYLRIYTYTVYIYIYVYLT